VSGSFRRNSSIKLLSAAQRRLVTSGDYQAWPLRPLRPGHTPMGFSETRVLQNPQMPLTIFPKKWAMFIHFHHFHHFPNSKFLIFLGFMIPFSIFFSRYPMKNRWSLDLPLRWSCNELSADGGAEGEIIG